MSALEESVPFEDIEPADPSERREGGSGSWVHSGDVIPSSLAASRPADPKQVDGSSVDPPQDREMCGQAASGDDVANPPLKDDEVEDMSKRLKFSKSLVAFGLDLYQSVRPLVPGNVCLPTFSVATLLASLLPCLKRDWRILLQQVLHLEGEGRHWDYYKECIDRMKVVLGKHFSLLDGCRIGMDCTHPYTFFFVDATLASTPIPPFASDIKTNVEAFRRTINDMVKEATSNHVKDIVPQGGISNKTNIVMVGGVHFDTALRLECEQAPVEEGKFRLREGRVKACKMLRFQGHFEANFSRELQCTVVHFPLKLGHLTMVVLVPAEGLAKLEERLTPQTLQDAISSLSLSRLDVTLPCFAIATDLPLLCPLKALGLKDLFTPCRVQYDIAEEKEDLHFDDFFHKTSFRLDSKALTSGTLHKDFVADSRLVVDEPFVFLIRFERTDSSMTLFMGRVTDPC